MKSVSEISSTDKYPSPHVKRTNTTSGDFHGINGSEIAITKENSISSNSPLQLAEQSLSDALMPGLSNTPVITFQKPSRATRKREKRAELRRAQEAAVSKAAAADTNSSRYMELRKIQVQLSERNLCLYEIPPDGDCLYSSIAHQLLQRHTSVENLKQISDTGDDRMELPFQLNTHSPDSLSLFLRLMAARHIRANKDHFLPFLFNPQTGEPMTDEEFCAYCDSVEKPSTWGGQIEIRALSCVLRTPVEVIQADGLPVIIGGEFAGIPITIVYHRHAFALGEHYNSCVPLPSNR
ncbi:unnamed protein product [Dicrocoelium dendriticum]|nr:unnamed protein product [Dicrocoelium dendriticum]